MKSRSILLFSALVFLLSQPFAFAQEQDWSAPYNLPKWMTPEEELRKHEIGEGFILSQPPAGPVRNIAEFERMQGVMIRYNNGLGIPLSLVNTISQHAKVITIAANNTQRNNALNAFQGAGVNMNNVEFIIAGTNSIWTRDYGPLWIINEDLDICVLDFPYNRPRPLDNAIPGHLASHLGVPIYGMNVVHTGGNYMSTGYGIAASTDLVYEENGNNQTWVNQQMEDYAGIHTYHVTLDAQGAYIKHIDTWAKFLDVDKIVIGQVPPSHNRFWAYEYVADYFANQISAYGTPFQVYRVYTPNGQPYTNSLILNHRVYVPTMNSVHDAAALAVYQEAMPGYEVIGVFHTGWQSTDALHCRVKEVADIHMLSVRHVPLHGLHNYQPEFEIEAEIIAHSGADLYADSLFLIYKANHNFLFDTVTLVHVEDHTYSGFIPVAPGDTLITYYLFAADESGRRENWPLVGAPGARSFQVRMPADIVITPDSLVFETYEQAFIEGLAITISNPYLESNLSIEDIIEPPHCLLDDFPLLPLTILPGESLELILKVAAIPTGMPEEFVVDTLTIISGVQPHHMKVYIKTDLFTAVSEPGLAGQSFTAWPNPFSNSVSFEFVLISADHVNLGIFDLQGRKIALLADETRPAGKHQISWDAFTSTQLHKGIYLVRLITGSEVVTRRIIFTR